MEFKVIISDGGKTYQKEIKGEEAARMVGLRIGDVFDGGLIGESGKLQVTGGTDKDGFPMKRGIPGSRRLKILMKRGPGFIPRVAGERRKKRVRGDTISEDIVQINTKTIVEEKKKKKVKVEKVEEEKIEAKEEIEEVKKVEKPKKVKAKKVKEPKKGRAKEVEKKEVEKKEVEKKEVEKKEVEKKEVEKKEEVKKVEKAEKEKEVKEPKKVKEPKEVKEPKKVKEPKEVKEPEKVKEPKAVKKKAKEERLVALTKVKGIGKVTADLLTTAGITSAQEFLKADTAKLAKKTGLTPDKIEKLKAQAEEQMG